MPKRDSRAKREGTKPAEKPAARPAESRRSERLRRGFAGFAGRRGVAGFARIEGFDRDYLRDS